MKSAWGALLGKIEFSLIVVELTIDFKSAWYRNCFTSHYEEERALC